MKIQTSTPFLSRLAVRRLFRARRVLPLTALMAAALCAPHAARAANVSHTIASGASGNISDSAQYSAGGAPDATTAGDILQDAATSSPGAFTLTVDIPVTIGTIKLNVGGNHTGTFSAGAGAFTLDNTGGTAANIFGNTDASIAETANAGLLTIGANIIAANSALDIGSTQIGTVAITGNITASTATTLYLRQNATQTATTITDYISGSIGATGSAIAITNASSGGGGGSKDIFSLSGAIGGAVGTGAAVTITNAATGSSPFNISGTLGASLSSITQNSAASTMTISSATSSFTGATSIQAGTLSLSSAAALAASAVTLSNTAGATLNVATASTIGSLAGGGTTGGNVSAATTLTTGNDNTSTTYAGAISGVGGLTKIGTGTLTLNGTNAYTGATTVNGGTLSLDRSATGAPSQIVASTSALALGGGTLSLVGNSSTAGTQTFASTTLNSGGSAISVGTAGAGQSVVLGTITRNTGSTVNFTLPTTGSITTGSGTASTLLTGTGNAPYAYVTDSSGNLVDFGAKDSTNTFIGAGSTVAAAAYSSPTASGNQAQNSQFATAVIDFVNNGSNTGIRLSGSTGFGTVTGLRFNSNRSGDWTVDTSASGRIANTGGILVTTNVGAYNVNVIGAGNLRQSASGGDLILAQDNTNGYLNISAAITTGSSSSTTQVVKEGRGTLYLSATNVYTGQSYLNGGATLINTDASLGAVGTGATVNFNNGTLISNATLTLDNAGANKRNLVLAGVGGTLAAATGTTLTVDGAVSGAGGLSIGTGTIAGSGTGTENTAVTGNGTVVLTGGNSYTGITTLNAGTLNINGQFALGGLVYGGLTFNGGTLQYAASLPGTNGTGDISATSAGVAKPVTVGANGGTIDTNGNAITYANGIGNGGTGALTIKSTATGGSLTLAGANTYTGATNVTGATLVLSTGNINASPTVNVTASGALTLGNATALSDTGTLFLASGTTLNLNGANNTSEVIGSFELSNGTFLAPGTYAYTDLNTDDPGVTFTASGGSMGETLTIGAAVPEPGTCVGGLLLVGAAGWSLRRRFVAGKRIVAA